MTDLTHLILPREEAKQFQDTGKTRLLFPVVGQLLAESMDGELFAFRVRPDTSAQYPAHTKLDSLTTAPEGVSWQTSESSSPGWANILNAGRLWNFLGDATHGTTLIATPHGLAIDQHVTLENKYNVPKLSARVSNIELLRSQLDLAIRIIVWNFANRGL